MTAWRYDVIVVGAGPAGSAIAILLAEHGHAVLVLDKAAFPRPKVCGEYLSPEASRILDRLGVLKAVDAAGAVPLRGMRITAPDGTVLEGTYPAAGPYRGYRDHALAVRRLVFDRILLERVKALPVDVRERHRVEDLLIEGDQVVGVRVAGPDGRALEARSALVVGADGRQSVVAQRLGLMRPDPLRRLALVVHAEQVEGLADRGEIYVDPPDYAILNPVAPGVVNVSLVVPLEHATPFSGRLDKFFLARLKQLVHVQPRLHGMRTLGPVAALGPLAYRVSPPRMGGVFLVGDAAGFYDPFTGEGIYAALRSAELAANVARGALAHRDFSVAALAPIWRARQQTFRGKERLARLLQVVVRRRRLANVIAHQLARRPDLLNAMLGVIGDYVPPSALLSLRMLFKGP